MAIKHVCIGIHVHAEPERLRSTIASVRHNTTQSYELLLLPDGPDVTTRAILATLRELPQSATAEPRGAAACFNRLAGYNDADAVVLLESGSVVAPGWLDHLLAALEADARNGLAGPSTNDAWNAQCVWPNSGGTLEAVARRGQQTAQRFGRETQTLEPLHSLADFCYAVRREVISEIGAADEAYGLGPCWEMDYNIRAARAGWHGVWARGAYVWRAPFTARRRLEEARRIEASKRLYQDRFCGARLRGEKTDYRAHCRGDECPNFAPTEIIQIQRPLPETAHLIQPPVSVPIVESAPLVNCIMPTCDRRGYIPQAIRNFLRQDYPNLELLILDDGVDTVADCVPEDARIRYLRLDQKMSIGAKRNLACEQSSGEYIVHWDDDDWYPTWRVRAQIQAMVESTASLCGTSQVYFFDPNTNRAWQYKYGVSGVNWVAGSTLAYRRSFWEHHKFPDIQVGEDSRFVWSAAGNKICDLSDPTLCMATVHASNTSPRETGGAFWLSCDSEPIKSLLGDDWYFYRTVESSPQESEWPLVSCIMPTWNRRPFLSLALQMFRQQDYPNRELIIIDDGDDPVGDLAENMPGVHYIRLTTRASIGAKRNLACRQAQGQIIAHWDDDDWYSPDRLRYQVAPILAGQADLTGLENTFVMQLPDGDFWTTRPELHRKMFIGDVHGGTLVFRRELLELGIRYPEINLAEDAWLLQRAIMAGKRLMRLSNPGVFVYVRHGRNAWRFDAGDFLNPDGWLRIPTPIVFPEGVLSLYKAAGKKFEQQQYAG